MSPAREASAGAGSMSKERLGGSSDEAESVSVRRIKRADNHPQPSGGGINSLYMGKTLFCLAVVFMYVLID